MRVARVVRGALAGTLATGFALAFHVAAGAAMPGWQGVVVPLVASVFVAVILGRRRLSATHLAFSSLAAQYFFHQLFMLGTVTAGLSTHGGGHHGSRHGQQDWMAAPAIGAHDHAHSDHEMLLAHLLAAGLTTVLLHRGETWLRRIGKLTTLVIRRLVACTSQPPVAIGEPGALRLEEHIIRPPAPYTPGASFVRRGPPLRPSF